MNAGGEAADIRRILRSTSIVGAATVGTILFSLVRMKLFALWVGPTGIGLFGIIYTFVTAGSTFLGFGLGWSGVQLIASKQANPRLVNETRVALWLLTWVAVALSIAIVWLLQDQLAVLIGGGAVSPGIVALAAVGIGLTLLSASQLVELQAYRRVEDFARVRLYGAGLATVIGVAMVFELRSAGIIWAILAIPAAAVLVGLRYGRRLPKLQWKQPSRQAIGREWRSLTLLGLTITITALIGSLYQLGVRVIIARDLGVDAAGLFQAAWMLAATTTGLVLTAMAADYYPRLSEASDDPRQVSYIFNQQLSVSLLIGGPLLTMAAGAAPIAMQLFYSDEFVGGTRLFQWCVAAEFVKLTCWAAGYMLLARRHARGYIMIEALFAAGFIPSSWFLLQQMGLEGVGLAYLLSYAAAMIVAMSYVRLRYGLSLTRSNAVSVAAHTGVMLAIMVVSTYQPYFGLLAGLLVAAALLIRSVRSLEAMGIRLLPRFLARR